MFNKFITCPNDLVTTHEQTRAGFLSIALEKNMVGDPYVKRALAFKTMVSGTTGPDDFLDMPEVRPFVLTASGLSDKAMNYLDEDDKTLAIKELIENFLKPAGENYIDETIYRYLLVKGDAMGGTMRNRIGALGQEKLIRALLSSMNVQGITYKWLSNESKKSSWKDKEEDDAGIEKTMKAIYWENENGSRVFAFNLNIPVVGKNVDLCLFDCDIDEYGYGTIVKTPNKAIMLGELKGGIDPAGADEHWKTANTALDRIRNAFTSVNLPIKTSFVGAAIENAMSQEIFDQLNNASLTNAANLTNNNQLIEYCNWLLKL